MRTPGDVEIMGRCYRAVNSIMGESAIHPDVSRAWWRTGKEELAGRNPIDALLDGDTRQVFTLAEIYAHKMTPLKKARQ